MLEPDSICMLTKLVMKSARLHGNNGAHDQGGRQLDCAGCVPV